MNLKIRWGNRNSEGLNWVIHHCSLRQSTMVRGKNDTYLCWVLHNGTWYEWECMFLKCLRAVKVCHFYLLLPCHGRFYTSWQFWFQADIEKIHVYFFYLYIHVIWRWLEMKTREVKRRKLKERSILCAINAFYALYIIHVWYL